MGGKREEEGGNTQWDYIPCANRLQTLCSKPKGWAYNLKRPLKGFQKRVYFEKKERKKTPGLYNFRRSKSHLNYFSLMLS